MSPAPVSSKHIWKTSTQRSPILQQTWYFASETPYLASTSLVAAPKHLVCEMFLRKYFLFKSLLRFILHFVQKPYSSQHSSECLNMDYQPFGANVENFNHQLGATMLLAVDYADRFAMAKMLLINDQRKNNVYYMKEKFWYWKIFWLW